MKILMAALAILLAEGHVELAGQVYRPMDFAAARGESKPATADFDGDGVPEIVVPGEGAVSVFAFVDGAFQLSQRVPAGAGAEELDLADLNGDGRIDVVVANHDTDHLTLLYADPAGAFAQPANSPLRIPVDPHPHIVRALDVYGDGLVDLVVDDRNGHGLRYLEGDGRGGFRAAGLIGVGGDPYRGFAAADLNGDGRPDFVTPNPDRVAVVLGGESGYQRAADVPATAPFAVALADLDGDGLHDLVVADDGRRSEVRVFLGDGKGGFRPFGSAERMARGGKDVVTGDIDGDGRDDALVSGWNSELLAVFATPQGPRYERLPAKGNPWGMAIADFNGDQRGDLVIADGNRAAMRVYLSVK